MPPFVYTAIKCTKNLIISIGSNRFFVEQFALQKESPVVRFLVTVWSISTQTIKMADKYSNLISPRASIIERS